MSKDAKPKVHISYLREAWVTKENNSVRLTFDRAVSAERELSLNLKADRSRSTSTELAKHVILELKFTGRFPHWFRELVETFGLAQTGAAKYCEGIIALGEDKMFTSSKSLDLPLPQINNWQPTPMNLEEIKRLLNK